MSMYVKRNHHISSSGGDYTNIGTCILPGDEIVFFKNCFSILSAHCLTCIFVKDRHSIASERAAGYIGWIC